MLYGVLFWFQDTVAGFMLAGIEEKGGKKSNCMVVDSSKLQEMFFTLLPPVLSCFRNEEG